jgi:hypothetical protein
MKKVFFLIVGLFVITACSKKEVPFEVFSPEAFAFDLGESWEVNASARVKGFTQLEKDGTYKASIKFSVGIVKPDGHKIESVFNDEKTETKNEVIMDLPLEAQFELDSTFVSGEYKLIFIAEDNNSDNRASAEISVQLNK